MNELSIDFKTVELYESFKTVGIPRNSYESGLLWAW